MKRSRVATLALVLLLVVPPAALAAQSPAPGTPGVAPGQATPTETPAASDASASTVLAGLYKTADVEADPQEPLPRPADEEPLVTALEHLADARGTDVDDEALQQARDDAADLPPDLRAALALIVEANAQATEDQLAASEAGTLDRTQTAHDALLVARSIDAALPVLRKYSLVHGSEVGALQADQARTVDRIVALATGAEPLQRDGAEADLPGAVLSLYDQLGLEPTARDTDRLEAGTEALPQDAREAATILVRGQVRSTELRAEAFSDLSGQQLGLLASPRAAAALADEPNEGRLETGQAWAAAVGDVDREALAQAQLVAVTASLQANAVLEATPEEADEGGVLETVWNGVTGFIRDLSPIGVASAQNPDDCPRESPLADCQNDVWFTDPWGIVVLSGPGSTVYDARYGQTTVSDESSRLLKRLPTDGLTVESRAVASGTDTTVEGSIAREEVENRTDSPTVHGVENSTLQRPFYAVTLDLGGDDVYVHHTASTLPLDPVVVALDSSDTTVDDLTFGIAGEVNGLEDVASETVPIPDPEVVSQRLPLFASVLVETGGDDLYDPGIADRANRSIASAGTLGLAVLLDASGDDRYRGGNHSIAAADTMGRSVLLDLDGEDTYEADAASAGTGQVLGTGLLVDDCAAPAGDTCPHGNDTLRTGDRSQGWGSLGGLGVLVNRGGSDAYALDGSTGQGQAALLGTATFLDVAGDEDEGIRTDNPGQPITEADTGAPLRADVLVRPNEEPVRGTVWAETPGTANGVGLAAEVDHPAAFRLTPGGDGVIASVDDTSAPGVDLPGLFFVDGVTDTVYERDYVITVDLAGSDTYLNNAGGAIPPAENGEDDAGGTALALDLTGADRYEGQAAETRAWGVQGAADAGAGLLVDLGKTQDRYRAGDRGQGAAADGGVGVLLDDGAYTGEDRFHAEDVAQGSGVGGGIGALATLNGHATYEAGTRAQGFGNLSGVGILLDQRLDRRADKVQVDGIPDGDPAGNDTYEAEALAQGAARSGGLGLLADTGGDDKYTLTEDRGQGYAVHADGRTTPSALVRTPQASDTSRGVLVDLTGRDTYTAEADDARVHGYAEDDPSDEAARALLADFALPRVPLLEPDAVAGNLPELADFTNLAGLGGTVADTLPGWDPTDFYDDWLREGRGDEYHPATTPKGREKVENGYWEQPPRTVRDDCTTPSTDDPAGNASAGDADPAVGLGMDNPPIAAPKAGVDRFFHAARMVEGNTGACGAVGVDIRGLVVEEAKPDVDLETRTPAEEGCGDETVDEARGTVCLEATVQQAGTLTGAPDQEMEVTFQIRDRDADGWTTLETVRTPTYYERSKRVLGGDGGGPGSGAIVDLFQTLQGPSISRPVSYLERIGEGTVRIVETAPGSGLVQEAVATFEFSTDLLCSETHGVGACEGVSESPVDAPAWPDGDYQVRAEVRTVTATATAGRAESADTEPLAVDNEPRLLGVDVEDVDPASGDPATFDLYTSEPHRGYNVTIQRPSGTPVAALTHTTPDGFQGEETTDVDLPEHTVYRTEATWLPEAPDLLPATLDFWANVTAGSEPIDRIHTLATGEDPTWLPLQATVHGQRPGAAVTWTGDAVLVAGGGPPDDVTDDVLLFEPGTSRRVAFSTSFEASDSLDDWSVVDAGGPAQWERTDERQDRGDWSLAITDAGPNERDVVTSPHIDLSGIESPRLHFKHSIDGTENQTTGCVGCPPEDYGVVELSRVGSQQWNRLGEPAVNTGGWDPFGGDDGIDLSAYEGEAIQLRFRFLTEEGGGHWAVDDLRIQGDGTRTLQQPLPDPLTNASAVWDGETSDAYVVGGRSPDGLQDEVLRIDTEEGTVETVATLPTPRADTAAVWHEDPGFGRDVHADDFEAPDSLDPWTVTDASGPESWERTDRLEEAPGDWSLAVYDAGPEEEDDATTPVVDLSGYEDAELRFRHKLSGEVASTVDGARVNQTDSCLPGTALADCGPRDYGVVQISRVGNPGWTDLTDKITGTDGWVGESIPLSDYVGDEVQIRLHFVTDDGGDGALWAVDDFSVVAPDDHAVIFGGAGPDGPLDDVLVFDPVEETVEPADVTLPSPRSQSTAVLDHQAGTNGAYFVYGGTDGHRTLPNVARFPRDLTVPQESFEDQVFDDGWTRTDHDGPPQWTRTTETSEDGDASLGIVDAGADEHDVATSPILDLSNLREPVLTLETKVTGKDCLPGRCPGDDVGTIEVTTIPDEEDENPRTRSIDPVVQTDGWEERRLDLSSFAGERIEITLTFTSDDRRNGTSWFVDAIEVVDPYDVELPEPRRDAAALPHLLASGEHAILGGLQGDRLTDTVLLHEPGEESTDMSPLEIPTLRQDTLVTGIDGDGAFLVGAGDRKPGETVSGEVHLDAGPPEITLPRDSGPIGCPTPSCAGAVDAVEIPLVASDDRSGVARVEVDVSGGNFTEACTLTPEDPTCDLPGAEETGAVGAERDTRLQGVVRVAADHGDVIQVKATPYDGADNAGSTVFARYDVDLQPPTNVRTRIPGAPSTLDGGDVAVQNRTAFPVGWVNLPQQAGEAAAVHLQYRIPGVHGTFRDGPTVHDPDPKSAVTVDLEDLAPSEAKHGAEVELTVRAEDAAGNLQPASDAEVERVRLDLLAPDIRSLDVDPGFETVTVSWNLTEPSVVHRVDVAGPDGFSDTVHRVTADDPTDRVTLVVPDLEAGTTYDVTVTSLDEARNPASKTVNVTTEESLVLEWQEPLPGALLSGEAPVGFLVGAADASRDDPTSWSLHADGPDGETATVVDAIPLTVDGTLDDPEPPAVDPYPPTVDTARIPDGETVTLQLVVENPKGATTATRTVTVDNTPPTVPPNATVTLEGPAGPVEGDLPWFAGPVNVTAVPAVDAVTGVNTTFYTWGEGDPNRTLADGIPQRSAEGIHTFRYRSVDAAGNAETSAHAERFGIDRTPPTLNVSVDDRAPDERNVSLAIAAEDPLSGAVQVRTALGGADPGSWTAYNDSTAAPTLRLPAEDGRHTVTVEVRDRAGNVARENLTVTYSTRPPVLDAAPEAEALSPTSARITWTTDKPSRTAVELVNASASVVTATPGFTVSHRVTLEDLAPGSAVDARVVLEDEAGHANTSRPFTVETLEDLSPPTRPTNLTAMDTRQGAVVVAWSPASDDAGIDRYVIERSSPRVDAFTPVANVTSVQYVDRDVDLGETYAYRVHAVDMVGKTGPSANATATPTKAPALEDPAYDVEVDNGTATLFLEVVVRERGRPAEDVRAVADGTVVPLEAANETDAGTLYRGSVDGETLTPSDGVDVAFLADDGDETVRHPDQGTLTVDASRFGADDGGDAIPGPGLAALLAAAATAIALRRGREGGGGGSQPRNLI